MAVYPALFTHSHTSHRLHTSASNPNVDSVKDGTHGNNDEVELVGRVRSSTSFGYGRRRRRPIEVVEGKVGGG